VVLAGLTTEQLVELNWDWKFLGRPNQIAPSGDWMIWLLLAGRGFGKTRSAAEAVRSLVCGTTPLAPGAQTSADARDVMVEGESGILGIHPPDFRPKFEPSKRRLTWPNGAVATLYNAVEPDQLRGPQHSLAWCDELAKWRYAQDTWDMLQFGMRLGDHPQSIIATTPRPIPVLKRIMGQPGTVITRGSTFENRSNLAPSFLDQIVSRYEGTRLGRQELNAEVLDDIPGALWTRAIIDKAREPRAVPQMSRVVVAVDPSGTRGASDSGDSIGIVVAIEKNERMRAGRDRKRDFFQMKRHGLAVAGG
jgi:phage terminase large subunit-like protein